jgi:hypothetical protein
VNLPLSARFSIEPQYSTRLCVGTFSIASSYQRTQELVSDKETRVFPLDSSTTKT